MTKKLTFIIVMMLTMALNVMAADRRFTLVIDPGHGGHDAGAVGSISKEKNINLKVALAFGRLVERNCPDVRVVYTRKTDVFIPLDERANIANRAKADLFISVHTNALPKGKTARGFEVYTLGMHRAADNLEVAKRENSVILVEKNYQQRYQGFDPRSAESYIIFEFMQDKNMAKSVEMAKMIQQEVCAQAARPNKGVHQAGFLVLRATSMPSCLVELGFITTKDEEQLLNSESGVEAHARGMYKAFKRYRRKYDAGFVVPYEAPERESVNIPTIVPETEYRQPVAVANPVPEPAPAANVGASPVENVDGQTMANVGAQPVESTGNVPVENMTTRASLTTGRPLVSEVTPVQTQEVSEMPATSPPPEPPIFKVQVLTSSRPLKSTDSQFKGEKNAEAYQENGILKYTIGASANYSEIYQLHKSLLPKFPGAFIIAFKNGEKTDVREAIQEYRRNRR